MNQEKKWFMSKKFWTPIFVAVIVALNNAFGWNIPEEQMLTVGVPFVIYLIGEFYLDRKRQKEQIHPLTDPKVRDAIEDLVSDFYDYAAAKDQGIEQHAQAIKDRVMSALEILMDPAFSKDAKAIGSEIVRIVMKMYKEDKKMQEGAELVKGSREQ